MEFDRTSLELGGSSIAVPSSKGLGTRDFADERSLPPTGPGSSSNQVTRFRRRFEELRWALTIYASTRIALLLLAIVSAAIFSDKTIAVGPMHVHHPLVVRESLSQELANWDGWWYVHIATSGYPTHVSHLQTTLGFFPMYSLLMWLTAHALFSSYVVAGMVISTIGGLVATLQVQRLTTRWWGPEVGRKAVALFCLFPGSIVFSMVYPESLLLPLALGCMLALGQKRWVLAGLLAGLATATGPDALPLVPMCMVASYRELRSHGRWDRVALRSLIAPVLSPAGAVAFAAFLWAWTGSPFANLIAQRYGWHEKTTPFAIPDQLLALLHELGLRFNWWVIRTGTGKAPPIDINRIVVLLGTVFLVVGLAWLWRERKTVPPEILVYSAFVAILMLTSSHVPPSPRLLLTGFPVVVVYSKRLQGNVWKMAIVVAGGLLLILSALTYVGTALRP